jgi:hypothetical protein
LLLPTATALQFVAMFAHKLCNYAAAFAAATT